MEIGDSSITFELRAWANEFSDWRRIRSDLAAAVYDVVIEAGWSFPFPQQEVRHEGHRGDLRLSPAGPGDLRRHTHTVLLNQEHV